ncbi:MAG: pilus assembly protein PilY, partial [Burkholderiaceae bacterium]
DISVIDINRDGFADRLYVGDTCGQMWRVNLFGTDMDEWSVTRMAHISTTTDTDIANKRKFMFPPDLVFGTDSNGTYAAVLAGSGDREHAFDTIITNEYYMFKDRDDSTEALRGAANSTSVKISGYSTAPTGSIYTTGSLFDATNSAVVTSNSLSLNGWRITLRSGEKVISSSTTVGGSTFFNTNQPSATAAAGICTSNLGVAREYIVGFADAAATQDLNSLGNLSLANRSSIRAGGGFLPSPVPVVVDIAGHKHEAVISGTSVRQPPSLTLDKRIRVYWYKNVD